MILKISSDNDYLADVLYKNPNTDFGLYFKSLKNGQVVGNVVDKHHYDVVFQDTKYSYLPEESNQIDYQSYCTPLAVLHICNELFPHVLKTREEFAKKQIEWLNMTQGDADTKPCTIEIVSFYIDSNWFRNERFLLSKYFEGIALEKQSAKTYRLTVTAPTIFDAINLLAITAIFAHVTNDYGLFMFIDDTMAQKFGRILTNIDKVPYFVFYLFIMKAVKSENQFEQLKPVFEAYLAKNGLKADLVLYNTKRHRLLHITNMLEPDIPILDIGCGELTFYKKMMAKGFAASYYAVDKNPDIERIAGFIGRRYDDNNLQFYSSLDDVTVAEPINILLTEVIEHNSMEEVKALIAKALTFNVKRLIITTPNIEFNQFYQMETELRHDDHQFELTTAEFTALIDECVAGKAVNVEYFQIGDSLNGIQPTQGVVIQ